MSLLWHRCFQPLPRCTNDGPVDDPERLLSGAQTSIADVPDGEPACQLRALIAVGHFFLIVTAL